MDIAPSSGPAQAADPLDLSDKRCNVDTLEVPGDVKRYRVLSALRALRGGRLPEPVAADSYYLDPGTIIGYIGYTGIYVFFAYDVGRIGYLTYNYGISALISDGYLEAVPPKYIIGDALERLRDV